MHVLRRCFSKEWRFFTFLLLSLVSLVGLGSVYHWLWRDVAFNDASTIAQQWCFVGMFAIPTLMLVLAIMDVVLLILRGVVTLCRVIMKRQQGK